MFASSVQRWKIPRLSLWIKLWLLKCSMHQISGSHTDCNPYRAPSWSGNFPEFFRMKVFVTSCNSRPRHASGARVRAGSVSKGNMLRRDESCRMKKLHLSISYSRNLHFGWLLWIRRAGCWLCVFWLRVICKRLIWDIPLQYKPKCREAVMIEISLKSACWYRKTFQKNFIFYFFHLLRLLPGQWILGEGSQ